MTIVMFACSIRACELMQELKQKIENENPETAVICKVKCSALKEQSEEKSLGELTGEWFAKADALLFICAAGIAVRSIAPVLHHKSVDPAVLVMDETAKFCISLLSGHAGGANELAERIAVLFKEKGTLPVITTATDREGKFAVDDFARRNRLFLTDWQLAKEISAGILQGEKTGILSEAVIEGNCPEGLKIVGSGVFSEEEEKEKDCLKQKFRTGILISGKERKKQPFGKTLQLIPPVFYVGIGCKKNTSVKKIEEAVESCFQEEGLLLKGICCIASIDLKKQEKGILDYCKKRELPFITYSARELMETEGDFTASGFVKQVTGADNVCERSAVLAARLQGKKKAAGQEKGAAGQVCVPGFKEDTEGEAVRLLVRKKSYDGVTIAVAEKTGRLKF
ncbi:MAG: cobalamin biosynthesis protein [Lachnospiraceae bacterium]|nr:cobalamin biosynthesis protein [Lachnospiraceae bacterium]